MRRLVGLLPLLLAGLAVSPLRAQDAPARVEYVAGGTLYLGVAEGGRWLPGDTVRLARAGDADWAGAARVLGVTATRLSAEWLTGPIPFAVGDSVRIELARPLPAAEAVAAAPAPMRPEPEARALPAAAGRRGVRVNGRIGLEVDALRSAADWDGTSLDNTSVLNTLRLRGVLSGLPADVRLRANVRGSYRHDDAGLLGPSALLFASELGLERTGRRVQLQAGRFGSNYEPYSGYWDGALLRVGSLDGVGVGAAYGFDPRHGNQGLEPDRRKATLFADLHRAGRTLRYDADVSVHRVWDEDSTVATAIGWTQQLSVRGVRVAQLLRVDDARDGWVLGLAQLSASAPLTPRLRLRLRVTHDDPHAFYQLPALRTWQRRGAGGSLGWFGGAVNAGLDVTATASERGSDAVADSVPAERRTATSFGGWLDVPATPLAGVGFELHASTWSGYGQRTLALSPGVRRAFGRSVVRAGYQLHRYEHAVGDTDTHAVSGALSTRFGRGQLDLQLRHDWGGGLRSTRAVSGLWVAL